MRAICMQIAGLHGFWYFTQGLRSFRVAPGGMGGKEDVQHQAPTTQTGNAGTGRVGLVVVQFHPVRPSRELPTRWPVTAGGICQRSDGEYLTQCSVQGMLSAMSSTVQGHVVTGCHDFALQPR